MKHSMCVRGWGLQPWIYFSDNIDMIWFNYYFWQKDGADEATQSQKGTSIL